MQKFIAYLIVGAWVAAFLVIVVGTAGIIPVVLGFIAFVATVWALATILFT